MKLWIKSIIKNIKILLFENKKVINFRILHLIYLNFYYKFFAKFRWKIILKHIIQRYKDYPQLNKLLIYLVRIYHHVYHIDKDYV